MIRPVKAVKLRSARQFIAGAAIAATALGMSACTASSGGHAKSAAAAGSGGDVLRIAIPEVDSPANLDPAQGARTGPDIFFDLAYAPLIHATQHGKFEAGLAQSWGFEDGNAHKTFQLTLRSGAKFSDGTPVDAAAVKAWLEYFMKSGGPFSASFGTGTTVDAPSANQVVIHLGSPKPDIEWLLVQGNGPGFVASTAALTNKALTRNTFGAGQYVYNPSKSVPGDTYTLTANKYYYDQSAIHWKTVVIKVAKSPTSLVQGLASGQFDVGVGDIGTMSSAKSAGLNVLSGSLAWDGASFLNIAGASNPLSNVKVRQALNYAIDRDTLVKGILNGHGTPTSAWVTIDGADSDSEKAYSYDPAKAKQLLADAGYPSGITFKLLTNAGTLPSGVPAATLVQAMAGQMQNAGITLKPTYATSTDIFTEQASGKYDATLTSFGMNTYGIYYPIFLAPQAPLNLGKVTIQPIEDMTKQYLTAPDATSVAVQVTKYVTDQAFELPVFVPDSVVFSSKKISNIGFPTSSSGQGVALLPDPSEWR